MKNGIPDRSDGEVLRDIYKKINIYGSTVEPLTTREMVILFCVGNYIAENYGKMEDDGK